MLKVEQGSDNGVEWRTKQEMEHPSAGLTLFYEIQTWYIMIVWLTTVEMLAKMETALQAMFQEGRHCIISCNGEQPRKNKVLLNWNRLFLLGTLLITPFIVNGGKMLARISESDQGSFLDYCLLFFMKGGFLVFGTLRGKGLSQSRGRKPNCGRMITP